MSADDRDRVGEQEDGELRDLAREVYGLSIDISNHGVSRTGKLLAVLRPLLAGKREAERLKAELAEERDLAEVADQKIDRLGLLLRERRERLNGKRKAVVGLRKARDEAWAQLASAQEEKREAEARASGLEAEADRNASYALKLKAQLASANARVEELENIAREAIRYVRPVHRTVGDRLADRLEALVKGMLAEGEEADGD